MITNPQLLTAVRRLVENNFTAIRHIVNRELSIKKKSLDIGCGTGELSDVFSPDTYYGVDISPASIAYAKRHHKGTFQIMDAERLDFPNNTFDNALIFGVLHHVHDASARKILGQARRVLRNDGRLLLIEDIPTKKYTNILGHLVHALDAGPYIRTRRQYAELFSTLFVVQKQFEIKSGVCDYAVFVLKKTSSDKQAI